MELLINSNSNNNSWEVLLTIAIAIAIVPKMSIAIVISILLISSGLFIVHHIKLLIASISNFAGSQSGLHCKQLAASYIIKMKT